LPPTVTSAVALSPPAALLSRVWPSRPGSLSVIVAVPDGLDSPVQLAVPPVDPDRMNNGSLL